MLLIIPILIRISAGALSRGAGVAIGRWAGGNIAKKYIATAVAKKAIDEGRKMALGESQRWQAAFKKDPAEAMRGAAAEFVNAEARDVIAGRSEISRELVTAYRQQALQELGREVMKRAERVPTSTSDTVLNLDEDAVVSRATESLLSRRLPLSTAVDRESSTTALDEFSEGNSESLGRSLASYADNPIENDEIIKNSARIAYQETIDDRALTRSIVGNSDEVQRQTEPQVTKLAEDAFDINES